MKKLLLVFLALLLCFSMVACKDTGDTQESGTQDVSGTPTVDKSNAKDVDIIIFMGSENMAGRGTGVSIAETVEGHAYEFKAISDPTTLYPMTADFGKNENKDGGLHDGDAKSGSMVPMFCESYYAQTKTPVIAVSASQGNTSVKDWLPEGGKLEDAIERLEKAKTFVDNSTEYKTRHIFMVWCQGEADAELATSSFQYNQRLEKVISAMVEKGVEKCMMIQIGNYDGDDEKHATIQAAQLTICESNANCVLISTKFDTLSSELHANIFYSQKAYDLVGKNAGMNAGRYAVSPDTYAMSTGDAPAEENQYNGGGITLPIDPFN